VPFGLVQRAASSVPVLVVSEMCAIAESTRAQAGIPCTIGLPRVQVNIVTEAGERDLVIAGDVKTKLAET